MPRPPSIEKDPISIAMILMRRQLGMTQEQLADALKVALPTIGRWESWDPPKGIMLERLACYAESREIPEAAAVFRRAVKKEHNGKLPPWFR